VKPAGIFILLCCVFHHVLFCFFLWWWSLMMERSNLDNDMGGAPKMLQNIERKKKQSVLVSPSLLLSAPASG